MNYSTSNFYLIANTKFMPGSSGGLFWDIAPKVDPDTFIPGQNATVEDRLKKIEDALFGSWQKVDLGEEDE